MPAPKITLYVDTVSPFAYEAYYILRHDPIFSNCEITYIPIFLGGVLKACGNTPPINIMNKDKWIDKERMRWAELFRIPIAETTPDGFPPLTLLIMRSLCALTILHPEAQDQFLLTKALDKLFHAFWVDKRKTQESEVLRGILEEFLGNEETEKVLAMAGTEGKALLAMNTDQALADGAFGLPWFVVTNSKGKMEAFWGVDHLGQVLRFLELERPSTDGWKALL